MSPSPSFRPSYRLSDLWRAPLHDFPIRDEILYQYLPLTADMELLEIGPGSGLTAFRLARRVRHLTLVDVAASNIKVLQHTLAGLSNVRLVCADASHSGLLAELRGPFDAAFGLEVFAYILDQQSCLQNLVALLRPGGQLLLQFPNYPQPNRPDLAFFRSREELDWLFRKAGFADWDIWALRLRPYAGFLFWQFAQRPLLLYRHWNRRQGYDHAAVYDQTWAFQHQHRLERFKPLLHAGWALLTAGLRVGGDAFERTALDGDVRNRNILVVARR